MKNFLRSLGGQHTGVQVMRAGKGGKRGGIQSHRQQQQKKEPTNHEGTLRLKRGRGQSAGGHETVSRGGPLQTR